MQFSQIARFMGATALVAFAAAAPAVAGVSTPVPAPLLGAGIPALAAFAGGYLVIRRRRRGK